MCVCVCVCVCGCVLYCIVFYCILLYFIILLGHSQQTLRSSYRVPKMNEIVSVCVCLCVCGGGGGGVPYGAVVCAAISNR